jgi:diguanylate cyclase (GGDEF)-like protein
MPSTSTSTLQLICLALVFGFSSLRPGQARVVGWSFIGMLLCVLMMRAWVHPASFNPQGEMLETAMTCLVLWLLTLLSYNFSLMRESVRAEKRELSEAAERVNQMMMHDALTGLHNRRQMQELLARECERQQRTQIRWCLALIDLDHFKHINDTHGHRVGDDVLIGFAKCAQTVLRETDMICRWGGEEFLVLLADTEPGPNALLAMNRLREHVATHAFGAGPKPIAPIQVTFSAGLAEHVCGEPIAATLERADKALYAAKAAGRNRCVMAAQSEPCEGQASQRLAAAQTPSSASLSF